MLVVTAACMSSLFLVSLLTCQRIQAFSHTYFHRRNGGVQLNNQNDFFDLEDDDYRRSNRRSKQNFVNTKVYGQDPVEDEFRKMRYPDEEDTYYANNNNNNNNNNNRDSKSYDETRRNDGGDAFYLDEDDIIDDDDGDESRLFERGGGNFWSNPKGGFDTIPNRSRAEKQSLRTMSQQSTPNQGRATR